MAGDDDENPRRRVTHALGDDLDRLSVDELEARVALLRAEIERLEAAAKAKRGAQAAAHSVFGSRSS